MINHAIIQDVMTSA